MRKILSLLLTVCLIFIAFSTLVSCGHTCQFDDEWSYDDEYHWHKCLKEDCPETSDKEEHEIEGDMLSYPTQEAPGIMEYRCLTCEYSTTDDIPYTGMTEDEWEEAFSDSVFENFEYNEVAVASGSGVTVETAGTYKFSGVQAWISITAAGQTQSMFAPSANDAISARNQLVASLKSFAPYGKFLYDAADKNYKAAVPVEIAALNASSTDVTLTFSDGKLVKLEYYVEFIQNNINFTASTVIEISYGNVEFD